MTRSEEKKVLRRTMAALEQGLSPAYKERSADKIARHLTALPEFQEADTVFCYYGRTNEINTRPILEAALAAGKRLCLPRCLGHGVMVPLQVLDLDQLEERSLGLLEPPADAPVVATDAIDFALIPCVTCNRSGHRLGWGGGYYDRFLSSYRGAAVLLCREKLLRDEIPLEPHDYPIPWVLTEKGLYEDGTPARLG